MRILHFADLHLDRSFAGVGMFSSEASKRREELRAALRRIVDLCLERGVDALTVGGDLYEHERATLDTGRFIARQFERLAPKPVLIVAGNHDPLLPDSLYRQVQWSANVHIFDSMAWSAVDVGEKVRIWGAGHNGPAVRDRLLQDLRVDRSGMDLALLHGSDLGAVPDRKETHCPFERTDVEACGARFVLLGHYHTMRLWPAESARFGYPGSPEPLGFDEAGTHYVLLVDIDEGDLRVEPVPCNDVSYRTEQVDVSGMSTSDEVREAIARLAETRAAPRDIVRVHLVGQADPELRIDQNALLAATADLFRYVEIEDLTDVAFPIDELEREATTKGAFVRIMNERLQAAEPAERRMLERARLYGLQAFEGQEVRHRVDHAD